jgi:hypothetical protein
MAHADEIAKLARQPFTIVQLELDNTISTGGAEYHCSGRSPLGQLFYSSIPENGFDPTPTRMDVGSGLGFRGTVRVAFDDFAFGGAGTYFGRLLAANPYYLDRKLKLYTGFFDGVTFDWANFKEHLYFIKRIDGPDSKGRVTIQAADLLTLLDEDQARTPTTPNAKLASTLTAGATGTINIGDNTDFSTTGGTAQINDEFVAYSGVSGADSIIITARAQYGTTAAGHDADDAVSPCYSYSGENVVDVIYDLIDQFSPIDVSTYINLTDWEDERDNYLAGDAVTGIVTAGTPIKDKIESLCSQAMISVWWDDEDQEIKLKAVGPSVTPSASLNKTEHILNVGEKPQRDPSKAITEVWVYYGRKNHADDEEEPRNYASLYITPDAEATAGHGKPKVKKIFATDIPDSGTSTVNKLSSRLLSQYSQGENLYTFRLDVKDSGLKTGQLVDVATDLIQGTDGLPTTNSFLVIERDQLTPTVFQYKAQFTGFLTGAPYRLIAPNTLSGTDYTAASAAQRGKYGFIADTSTEEFSNSDPAHLIL